MKRHCRTGAVAQVDVSPKILRTSCPAHGGYWLFMRKCNGADQVIPVRPYGLYGRAGGRSNCVMYCFLCAFDA